MQFFAVDVSSWNLILFVAMQGSRRNNLSSNPFLIYKDLCYIQLKVQFETNHSVYNSARVKKTVQLVSNYLLYISAGVKTPCKRVKLHLSHGQ